MIAGWSTAGGLVERAVANVFQRTAEGVDMELMLLVYWLLLVGLGALTTTRRWWAYAIAVFFTVQALVLTMYGGLPVTLVQDEGTH